MRYSQDFIEKVRDASNIVEVIGQYTELRRSGHQLMGLCPFPDHKEKSPSFSVSETKQVYFCFGCKKSGNIFTFMQDMQGLSFPEALEELASRASIPLPVSDDPPPQVKERTDERKLMGKLNRYAAQFFHKQLANLAKDHPARQYCLKRGIDQEIFNTFEIGVALDDWEGLGRHFSSHKAPLPLAEKLGLVKRRSGSGSGYYDVFRNRLIFPIISHKGICIGFGGRILGDGQPKYLNSPESDIFNKGHIFYGLHETAKHIRAADEAIVVEGYMDFLALYKAGIKNVVATLGTALTKEHARLLKRYTKNIVVLFDGDSAGQQAAKRSLPTLLSEGLLARSLVLPEGEDPDDFILNHGADELKQRINRAEDLFNLILREAFAGYTGSPADKVQIIDHVSPVLQSVQDQRLKELYVQELSERLSVGQKWTWKALEDKKSAPAAQKLPPRAKTQPAQNPAARTPEATQGSKIRITAPPKAELFLLNLALRSEDRFKSISASGIVENFSHAGLKEIFMRAEEAYRQMPSKFDKLTALLVGQVDPPEVISQYLDKPLSDVDEEGAKKLEADCVRKVRDVYLRTKTKELSVHLRGQSPSEQKKHLERIMNMHKNRHSLRKEKDPS